MRKITGIFFVAFFILLSANVFGQWTVFHVQGVPQGSLLHAVDFVDANTGCAGFEGIYRTTNAGQNWTNVLSTGIYIKDIKFYGQVGYATGSSGMGLIWKTTNGGLNWTNIFYSDAEYNKIYLVSENDIYIACPWSTTYSSYTVHSTDGGMIWETIFTTPEYGLVSTAIGQGLYISTQDHLYVNDNSNWIMKGNGEMTSFSDLKIANNVIYTGGQKQYNGRYRAAINSTVDQGQTWNTVYLNTSPNISSIIEDIVFDGNIGYAVGVTNDSINVLSGNIYRTTDGITWSEIYNIPNKDLLDITIKGKYLYAVGRDGIVVRYDLTLTGMNNNENSVDKFSLKQNFPNPFNPTTKISYMLSKSSQVTLKIYNLVGQEVVTLVNEQKNSGSYSVEFNGADLSSGAYFYKLTAGSFTSVKKMMLIK